MWDLESGEEVQSILQAVAGEAGVPFFFVSTGVRFDLDGLFANGETIARVPARESSPEPAMPG